MFIPKLDKKNLVVIIIVLFILIIVFSLYWLGYFDKLLEKLIPQKSDLPLEIVPGSPLIIVNLQGKIIEIKDDILKIEITTILAVSPSSVAGEPPKFETRKEIKLVGVGENTKIIKVKVTTPKDFAPGQPKLEYRETEVSLADLKEGDYIFAYKSRGFSEKDYTAEVIRYFIYQ